MWIIIAVVLLLSIYVDHINRWSSGRDDTLVGHVVSLGGLGIAALVVCYAGEPGKEHCAKLVVCSSAICITTSDLWSDGSVVLFVVVVCMSVILSSRY